jgi:hypothetical protein
MGYVIGVDGAVFSQLVLRRISDPGGSPSISSNLSIPTVISTTFPSPVPHLGNTGGNNGRLDALDDRLFAALVRGGRLWTAHNIGVNDTGTTTSPTRNASRWYELADLDTAPAVAQTGTEFDPTGPNDANQLNYWIPSIAVSGQGHAVLGFSHAGANARINSAFTGRLASDAPGTMRDLVLLSASSTAYNPPGNPGGSGGRRWGDYSFTSVDPLDDMTIWTIQEFNDATNTYGVQVTELLAPTPTLPCSSPQPFAGPTGDVTLTGTGFFDPGPDLSSPAVPFSHLAASVTGGTTVNAITAVTDTSVTLNITVTSIGMQDVTITNPDGQFVSASGCIDVTSVPVELQQFTVED